MRLELKARDDVYRLTTKMYAYGTHPSTSAATLELCVGLELEGRLTELSSYVVLCSIT